MQSVNEPERLVSTGAHSEEEGYERAIRPRCLDDYIGQSAVKRQMQIFVQAARQSAARRWTTC